MIKEYVCIMQPNFVVSEINREGSDEVPITEKNLC